MKTIYEKMLLYYLLAIILGFSFLGIGITEAFKSYFYSEKNQGLLNQARRISDIYIDAVVKDDFKALNELMVIDKYTDYSFFVTDLNLKVIASSDDININGKNIELSEEITDKIQTKDAIYSSDDFGEIYNENRYFICYPSEINDDAKGLVFVTTSLSSLRGTITRGYIVCGIFLFVAMSIGFVVLNLSMSKTLSGITKLNDAAKIIAGGNFEHRVNIDGKDEISQLANSFNEMADGLSRIEKNKQEFLSNIAHDIRSPLTSINGFLDALLDGTIPMEKADRYLRIIKSETERLSKLSNSILDINRIAERRFDVLNMEFSLNKMITSTLDSLNSRISDKNINLMFDYFSDEIKVKADYEKIQRVFYNLYDNAVKFTNEKGSIITKITKRENKALISITNTGVGLTAEECKRVFDRLYKADSSRGLDKLGSGLGLSIVKEFLNDHKENISVTSEPEKYTTFTFTLTLAD